MGQIIGRNHFAHIQNQEDVVGEWTAVLNYKIAAFVDEASLGKSDTKTKNLLKNLITGNTQRSRQMRKDPTYQDSFINFFLASNNVEQMVPAEEGARRFECYHSDVKPLLQHPFYKKLFPDKASYFSALNDVLMAENGLGLMTFANFLYHMVYFMDGWNANVALQNRMLALQKLTNLDGVANYWFELMKREVCNDLNPNAGWEQQIGVETLFKNYIQNEKQHGRKNQVRSEEEFWNKLARYLPRPLKVDEIFINQQKVLVFKVPPVRECRIRFKEVVPGMELIMDPQQPTLEMIKQLRLEQVTEEDMLYKFLPEQIRYPTEPLNMRINDLVYPVMPLPNSSHGLPTEQVTWMTKLNRLYGKEEEEDATNKLENNFCTCPPPMMSACYECAHNEPHFNPQDKSCSQCGVCLKPFR